MSNTKSNQENPILFSVIIPLHNKEAYISRTIQSVLNQTCEDFEIIVVDDASTDNSINTVKSINDSRIRIFNRSIPGAGGYAARNLGIEKARGKWICFLDADDVYLQNHLEKTKELINQYQKQTIFTSARKIREGKVERIDSFSNNKKKSFLIVDSIQFLKECIAGRRAMNSNSVCIKRSVINSNTLFPEKGTERSGDIYVWVKLVLQEQQFAWSSHIGSISFRDIVGVSKQNIPNVNFFFYMVSELGESISKQERIYLERYANRLIRTAWFENKIVKNNQKNIFTKLYWKHDVRFCLLWTILSYTPLPFLKLMKRIKKTMKINFI